jgi:hypothetical protein
MRDAPERAECNVFSCFRCIEVDCLLIKFEPTGEFNFEEQFYVFKINEFSYINSISTQR